MKEKDTKENKLKELMKGTDIKNNKINELNQEIKNDIEQIKMFEMAENYVENFT